MATVPEQLHVEFATAFNRQDLDAVIALYEIDAVLVTGGKPVMGRGCDSGGVCTRVES